MHVCNVMLLVYVLMVLTGLGQRKLQSRLNPEEFDMSKRFACNSNPES